MDFVNLMTYDFRVAGPGEPAGHHANLYPSPADPRQNSADGAVRDFLAAGVPASKLVLGVPFYGRVWEGVGSREGLYRDGRPPSQRIDTSHAALAALVGREGWVREWDAAAQAPFLWNEARKTFVTYEDEESLRLKSRYVREKGLGGVMFWEYHADRTGALLDTLDAALRGEDVVPLSGVWRFELDPADEGLVASWENRTLAGRIRLPGVLQAQGFGDDVTVDTKWTGQIVDRSFFTSPRYEPYRQPGQRQGPVLAAAGQALRRPGLVRARRRDPAGVEGPPRRAPPRAAALADDRLARRPDRRLERQPLDAARARPRHGRAGDAPAHDPRRQPPRRGRRPQLAQRHRPHAGQLERHRGPHRAAGDGAGVDRGPAGHAPRRAAHGDRPRNDRQCHEAGRPRDVTARRGSSRMATPSGRTRADVSWDAVGRRVRGRGPLGASAALWDEFSPVLHRLSAPTLETGDGRDVARGPLRPAGDRDAGHAVRGERPQDLPPRHARVRHLPEDRPPADRRGLLAAHRAHREGARPQHDPLPLVVPARGGLRRRRRGGLLLPGRGRLLGEQLHPPRRRPADRRVALPRDGAHPEGLRQPPVLRPPALRQRARRAATRSSSAAGSSTGRRGTRAGSTRAPRAGRRSPRTSST